MEPDPLPRLVADHLHDVVVGDQPHQVDCRGSTSFCGKSLLTGGTKRTIAHFLPDVESRQRTLIGDATTAVRRLASASP